MEVNVMADLLKITQEHKHYVMLDPVLSQHQNAIKPSYQLHSKKKVFSFAASCASLVVSSSGTCISCSYITRRC